MRTPSFKGNVIVSNLSSGVTPADLADLFDQYGLVLGAKIERWHDRPGGSQGTVDLAPDTAVDKAVAALNGQVLVSQKISVRRAPKAPAKQKAARPAAPPRPSFPSAAAEYRPAVTDHPMAPVRSRSVVVEYRPPSRRVSIPPRSTKTGSEVG